MTDTQKDLTGQVIGPYKLKGVIGRGGMGKVYLSYQPKVGREVAVKVLSPGLASQPDYLKRFQREVKIAADLAHPHIIPIIDAESDESRALAYVVMRYLPGGTLKQRMKRFGRPSLYEARQLITQIGGALDYAHQMGVIHRDLKTSNVMFDNVGNAYLVDFGIAKPLDDDSGLTRDGYPIGTPAYMAPELWEGLSVTWRADLYALGILSYAVLAGRLPYHSPSVPAVMRMHFEQTPIAASVIRPELPRAIDAVLQKAFAKKADERHESVGAFLEEFNNALQEVTQEKQDTGFLAGELPAGELKESSPQQVSEAVDGQPTDIGVPRTPPQLKMKPKTPVSSSADKVEVTDLDTGKGLKEVSAATKKGDTYVISEDDLIRDVTQQKIPVVGPVAYQETQDMTGASLLPDSIIASTGPQNEQKDVDSSWFSTYALYFIGIAILFLLGGIFGVLVSGDDGNTGAIASITEEATEAPTETPSETPTEEATETPTETPSETPTEEVTEAPTETPMEEATEAPTETPSETPTEEATEVPTETPYEISAESVTESITETPTRRVTPSPTRTSTPVDPPTFTPTFTATEPPFVNNLSELLEKFNEAADVPTDFDCVLFIQSYEFLEAELEAVNPDYVPAGELIDEPDDPTRKIYRDICSIDPTNEHAAIRPVTLLSDMWAALQSLSEDQN